MEHVVAVTVRGQSVAETFAENAQRLVGIERDVVAGVR